ncbi:MAG: hypothetical protein R3A51_17760 [Nannocystaceae bacterium]
MEIKKRSRAELKSYFVKNAIPTENNFADLIDGALVQRDDGLVKLPGDPLSLEATGDDTSQKPALSLYRSFTDPQPTFSLTLNPRADPQDPATAKPGLSVSDGAGRSRLFIAEGSGNVGIGTVEPLTAFHVKTAGSVGMLESTTNQAFLKLVTTEGLDSRVELANRPGGRLALWVAGHGDALSILRDGRVGVRRVDPQRSLHIGTGGEISLLQGDSVTNDSRAGVFWHINDNYSIHRSPGPWLEPDYQQLVLQWPTGIVLQPGTGPGAGYGRSYVDITGGKGLRVSDGTLLVGNVDPPIGKFKVAANASDYATIGFAGNPGELRIIGWNGGWNINATSEGKHLYLNRDSGPASNLYLGRYGQEVHFLGNGSVGVGGAPGAKLHVYGNIIATAELRADGGLVFGASARGDHLDWDGVFYRYQGQCYLTVDDNFYIRDAGGGVKFHFDTDLGVLRQDGWTAAALTQGWANYDQWYNQAGYYRDRQGVVHLRGLVRSGAVGWEATIFWLPEGYRPALRELHTTATNPNQFARVDITPDGRVIPCHADPGWVSLDGISFRVL